MDNTRAASDLISHLPGDVTVNILLRLPLQEAVKTSLLSKRWRYKWIAIPELRFDSSTTFSSESKEELSKNELLAIIHQVLFQHEGPISKFMLSVPDLESCPEIDHLISFLSRKSVEEFTLQILQIKAHKIPSYLFSCLKLRLLCLHNCVLRPPPDFPGFAKLTNLELCSVDLPACFAEAFVAKCPLLECLKLHRCSNIGRINFYAPNLKLLEYSGRLTSFSFKNIQSLEQVSIECDWPFTMDNTWIDTICSLSSLEYLQLGWFFISMADLCFARPILASPLSCLVTLSLSLHRGALRTAGCTLFLIESSPNLQKLVIKFVGYSEDEEEEDRSATESSKHVESSDFSSEKLQSVELSSIIGSNEEMVLIGLLLAKSAMLETMHIYSIGYSIERKLSALQRISQEPRLSPRAKVIFSYA